MTTASDPKPARKGHVAVRLEEGIQARIEALKPHLAHPWGDATSQELLRAVIRLGIEVAEKDPERLRARGGPALTTPLR